MSSISILPRFRMRRPNQSRQKYYRVDVSFDQETERQLKLLRLATGQSMNQIINTLVGSTISSKLDEARSARNEESWQRIVDALETLEPRQSR